MQEEFAGGATPPAASSTPPPLFGASVLIDEKALKLMQCARAANDVLKGRYRVADEAIGIDTPSGWFPATHFDEQNCCRVR